MEDNAFILALSKNEMDEELTAFINSEEFDPNKIINPGKEILIKRPAGNCPFTKIKDVSALVLCILFENPVAFKFILEKCKLKTFKKEKGWSLLHYAACTKDYECMNILLSYEYFRQNIDEKIEPVFEINNKNDFTTALHIAVTNRRHAQALMLTQEIVEIAVPIPEYLISPYMRKPSSKYDSANPKQLSYNGNSPLHIAVYQKDWDMCQILLNADNNALIKNRKSETPIFIAKEMKYYKIADNLEKGTFKDWKYLMRVYMPNETVLQNA